jgi:hypothetical protein
LIEQITVTILASALIFSLGYILRDCIAKIDARKPYNKQDLENVCKKLTDFEKLALSSKFLSFVDWEKIRPNELKDWAKFIINKIDKLQEYERKK